MQDTALTLPLFTIEASISEWLKQKETTRSGSTKTITAYGDTVASFRTFLADFGLDLLANPIDIARIAPIWASTRLPARLRNDGTPNKRHQGDVSNSTYNQRLAILSSWYTFVQEVYKLDIPNPVKDVARRNVQAYAEVLPIEPEVIETGLERINRNHLQGLRNYALLIGDSVLVETGNNRAALIECGRRYTDTLTPARSGPTLCKRGNESRLAIKIEACARERIPEIGQGCFVGACCTLAIGAFLIQPGEDRLIEYRPFSSPMSSDYSICMKECNFTLLMSL